MTWVWIQFQSLLGVPLAQEDRFIQARLCDLRLSGIKMLPFQIISGQDWSEKHESGGAAGEVIKFENVTIRASSSKYLGDRLGTDTVRDINSYSTSFCLLQTFLCLANLQPSFFVCSS
jgi:hypothetical protein